MVQAHRMLGVAYLYANRAADARREFHKLLELRPDYRFDPLMDPQPVVDAFNAVVKEEEAEIAAHRDAPPAARSGTGCPPPARGAPARRAGHDGRL